MRKNFYELNESILIFISVKRIFTANTLSAIFASTEEDYTSWTRKYINDTDYLYSF